MQGFTLVELLAVIVLLSAIIGVAGYVVAVAIRNSKEKANEVSYNSIMESAQLYVKEYYDVVTWNNISGDDFEYSCASIFDLVNKGYLKEEEISDIEVDYIQVNCDEDGKVIFEELFSGDNYYCVENEVD